MDLIGVPITEGKYEMVKTFDRMMAVYEKRKGVEVVFQPRVKHWYDVNLGAGTLPDKYQGKYLDEVYSDLDVVPREVWGFGATSDQTGYLSLQIKEGEEVEVWTKQTHGLSYETEQHDYVITEYRTPVGKIRQVQRKTERGTSLYNVEYFLKDLKDIEVYKYVLRQRSYQWDRLRYEWGEKRYGDVLPLRLQLPRSPLMWLIIGLMGFKKTVLMLWKHRSVVKELLLLLEEEFGKMLEVCNGKPIVELSLGDNMHQDMASPPLFKKYVIPFYKRLMPKIHEMGMYATSHWDGFVEQLLPLVRETGLDGLECVTPLPQGDVTLEDIKGGMDGMFLRDGIPAVLFCEWTSLKSLEDHVRKLLKMFYPNLILGISDMLPANADIERIRFMNNILKDFNESL